MDKILPEMISLATIAIALFGLAFCLMHKQFKKVYRSFALFLCAVAANNLSSALGPLLEPDRTVQTHFLLSMVSITSSLCLAPFFWIYVVTLTSRTQNRPADLFVHLALPICAFAVGMVLALVAPDLWSAGLVEDYMLPEGLPSVLGVVLTVMAFSVYVQLGVYTLFIVRRLVNYRSQLRDVYASTEQHELNWIFVIGGLGVLFWLVQVLGLMIALGFARALIPTALFPWVGLALFTAATLWGLRQRPGLVPDTHQDVTIQEPVATARYEKSALTGEVSARIERKLRTAMEKDRMYRDPNISLWVLARHVGASPNYTSQTLNDAIRQNFFDFINSYRIADAAYQLTNTDQTVLTIAYDVGFNTRSSFYTAFKRVTGQTPTAYRKNVSEPVGSDDTTVQPCKT